MNRKKHGDKRWSQPTVSLFVPNKAVAEERSVVIPRKNTIDAILLEGDPNVPAGVYRDLIANSFYR